MFQNMLKTQSILLILKNIFLKETGKSEKYECFLVGKWKKKNLIVIPSFNPLTKGTNVLEKSKFSPYIEDVSNFQVYVVDGEVYDFGKVKKIKSNFL